MRESKKSEGGGAFKAPPPGSYRVKGKACRAQSEASLPKFSSPNISPNDIFIASFSVKEKQQKNFWIFGPYPPPYKFLDTPMVVNPQKPKYRNFIMYYSESLSSSISSVLLLIF